MSKKKNKKKTLLDKLLYYFVIFILGALTGYIYEVIFYYITLGVLNQSSGEYYMDHGFPSME